MADSWELVIKMTEEYVRKSLKHYDTGHDWWHIDRVRNISRYINTVEKIADPHIVEITALLHDCADSKFAGDDPEESYRNIENFLDEISMTETKGRIIDIIRNVSFSNKYPSGNLSDPVLLIIQDADRLDAMGAIGIGRAFNYGGFRNRPIFSSSDHPDKTASSTISHFYDKLLRLKDLMHTPAGITLAEERHLFLETFLVQFYKEWKFGTSV